MSFLDEIDTEIREAGLDRAVASSDTPPIFDWLEDRRKPSIQLDKEPAIVVREPDPALEAQELLTAR